MSRVLRDEGVSLQPADLAGWLRNGNAIPAAPIGARAKEQG